jgi:hypothetical protein
MTRREIPILDLPPLFLFQSFPRCCMRSPTRPTSGETVVRAAGSIHLYSRREYRWQHRIWINPRGPGGTRLLTCFTKTFGHSADSAKPPWCSSSCSSTLFRRNAVEMSFSAEVLGRKTGVSSSTGSSRRCTDFESNKSYLRVK